MPAGLFQRSLNPHIVDCFDPGAACAVLFIAYIQPCEIWTGVQLSNDVRLQFSMTGACCLGFNKPSIFVSLIKAACATLAMIIKPKEAEGSLSHFKSL